MTAGLASIACHEHGNTRLHVRPHGMGFANQRGMRTLVTLVLALVLGATAWARTDPKVTLALDHAMKRQNLPTGGLGKALRERHANLSGAVTQTLSTPNLAGTTWAPVKEPIGSSELVERYIRAGLLRRAEDGRLYARLRDPSTTGTDPQHNRCIGVDSCMAKGTGTFEPVRVALAGGEHASVALYQDPDASRSYHVFKGVLTAEQAEGFIGRDYRALLDSLKRELVGDRALRDLVDKHHLSTDIIPNKFLTLELEAFPVAPEGAGAKGALHAMGNVLASVAKSIARDNPKLVWLKPDAYWKIALTKPTEAKNPRAVVQLYTANHAAIRAGTMAGGGKAMGQLAPSMPALDWGRRYSDAEAAVRIGWWTPFFKDYGWELRREKSGVLRVYDLGSSRPLALGGDALHGSLQAARVLNEGNALVSGLVLRSLWRANLTPIGSLGGTPFQGRNSNPRTRLDLDTIGPQSDPRPIDIYTTKQLTRRDSRKFDLTWSTDPFYWKNGMAKTGSPISGLLDVARALGLDLPDKTHGERLMLRVALGGKLDGRAGLIPPPQTR
jgi:hypothetical protein